MPSRKQSNNQDIRHMDTRKISRFGKVVLSVIATILLGIVVTLVWLRIGTNSVGISELTANVTPPSPSTFTDDNTMMFTNNGNVPDVNNARELSAPGDVVISYNLESGPYQPTFKINLTDKELSENIKITPVIRGKWHLRGDSMIVFTPESNWPADKKFTIKINPDIFNDDVRPDTTNVSFTTPPISATIDSFDIYATENAQRMVNGVAVISFNYEIDTTEFSNRVSLRLDDTKLGFNVKFDKYHRTAFIISDSVAITDEPQNMHLKLNRVYATDGDSSTKKITGDVTLESADNIFKISELETNVADDTDGNAHQLIILNTTVPSAPDINWMEYIDVYLLPRFINDTEKSENSVHHWLNDEVTDQVLSNSDKLNIKQTDFVAPNGINQYTFAYKVSDGANRYVYVNVKPGAKSASGFQMRTGISKVMRVPYPQQSVTIAGTGALLSLSGDRRLGIVARGGVDTAYVNLYKIKSGEINHLISQTYDVFAPSMEFKSWNFGVYDMSTVFQKEIPFANPSMIDTEYASLDLGDYLDRTYGDNTGIFVIQTGTSENAAEFNDKRLILLTDLGIIRKVNNDTSSDLFVSNISTGTPATDIEIYVLGRNGNSVWSGRTDSDGHTEIPQLPWSEYKNAREPVAIVARRGDDVSFIPYNAYAQRTEYSKYDIDGNYVTSGTPLNAYIFSDRGIYRPGEEVIIAGIVKNQSFNKLSGIPVRMELRDSRGRMISEQTFSLTPDGMFDIRHKISDDAQLGTWYTYLYLINANNKNTDMLGMTSFDVQEFVPDTMKISATLSGKSENGWISPNNISANISLRNLFGTPASDRRVSVHAILAPTQYKFDKYPDYNFAQNFISDTGLSNNTITRVQTISRDVPDVTTDANGNASVKFDINDATQNGTYMLTLNIRGFESNSGKSVQTNITARASNAKYLIGYKTANNLEYIRRNSNVNINLIALDHTANPIDANGLTMRIMKHENMTSLVKDYNNNYKYQTVSDSKLISQSNINISSAGSDINLDTKTPGTYTLQIQDSSDSILANIEYFVANDENASMETDTDADLQIKLDADEYAPGDDIAISITAPYTGTGLITIERDRVYAYKWFNTNSTSSVQHIRLPHDFSGTGYINVSFVRDITSRDIFTSPYAYAVAPFATDTSGNEINIALDVPEQISDNNLVVQYTTNAPARIMIFAINQGILQVAKYKIPNPLAHFFQKSALQVNTFQILSLLLPEYNILREFAQTGGGDYGGADGGMGAILTNPFGRDNVPPVAFYSGILETDANIPGTYTFNIPETFDGTISVFAVASNETAVGSANTTTLVQSPIMISNNVPMAVAPNDEFNINSVITNMSGAERPDMTVSVQTNNKLELTGATTVTENIPNGTEKLFTFNARASDKLGNATITVNAQLNSESLSRASTANVSVRPTTTYVTDVKFGEINSKHTTINKSDIKLYPDFASSNLYISNGAPAMIVPLVKFLEEYEYPCSEQLVSRAIPYLTMPTNPIIGTTFDKSTAVLEDVINTLKNRQNDDGSFAMWNGNSPYTNNINPDTAYLTAYIVHFLTLAKDSGFYVPDQMFGRGIDFLRTYAGAPITDTAGAAAHAYAIYVISLNDYVTTSYIDVFTEYANENIDKWSEQLMGAYIAASYKLLHQDTLADDLISKYKTSKTDKFTYTSAFNNNVANDAMYYYVLSKHFDINRAYESDTIQSYISGGNYSSYTSSVIILALSGTMATDNGVHASDITVTINGQDAILTQSNGMLYTHIENNPEQIEIICDTCSRDNKIFYTLINQGYPLTAKRESNGLEIIREYYDVNGNEITSGKIGDTVTVKIFARTRGGTDYADNVVITDLLPGGFIADTQSVSGDMNFAEVREDRILIYADLTRDDSIFTYTAQLGASGKFAIPAINATAMNNPQINATGGTGIFTVSE